MGVDDEDSGGDDDDDADDDDDGADGAAMTLRHVRDNLVNLYATRLAARVSVV